VTTPAYDRQRRPRGRANGEGSIYPYRDMYAAYVWVTTPAGERKRKYVYGKTREIVHAKWIELQAKAAKAPVPTVTPTLEDYLASWLAEVIKPNRELATYDQHEILTRLYIVPALGGKRIDRLRVREVQTWLNGLAVACQCCAQGKDARRAEGKRRCCAAGECCESYPGKRTVQAARNTLRAALSQAVVDEIVSRNVASLVQVPTPPRRRRKGSAWSVEEASRFLESARYDGDPLYAAYVLTLVLGLRKGEVLGLPRTAVDTAASELDVSWQLQRIRGQLIHKKRTKADDDQSGDILPLPDICLAALELRSTQQDAEKESAGEKWKPARLSPSGIRSDDLVFTTATGTNRDPRNFNRSFNIRCDKAGVRRIRVHDTRHTCASLLAALDVHPRVAMAILRHAQIAITMEIYTEVPDEVTRAALKRLGDQLSPESQG
jgi:integrase